MAKLEEQPVLQMTLGELREIHLGAYVAGHTGGMCNTWVGDEHWDSFVEDDLPSIQRVDVCPQDKPVPVGWVDLSSDAFELHVPIVAVREYGRNPDARQTQVVIISPSHSDGERQLEIPLLVAEIARRMRQAQEEAACHEG